MSAVVAVQDLYAALLLHIHQKNTDSVRSLLVSPGMSIALVHSVMQCMNREGRRGRKRVDTVTVAPVAYDKVYTPMPCLVSIIPQLTLGQSAR